MDNPPINKTLVGGNIILLVEVKAMKDKLVVKDAKISHAEVPAQFVQIPSKKQKVDNSRVILQEHQK